MYSKSYEFHITISIKICVLDQAFIQANPKVSTTTPTIFLSILQHKTLFKRNISKFTNKTIYDCVDKSIKTARHREVYF